MLIPHNRGERRQFELSSSHLWGTVAIVMVLCFTSGFFFQRTRVAHQRSVEMQLYYQDLERNLAARTVVQSDDDGVSASDLAARERALRAEYDARDRAIIAELSRLYELEAEVRSITGMPAREEGEGVTESGGGGQGGAPGTFASAPEFVADARMRPPAVIYGLNRPSADLMVQEIDLRSRSLNKLLAAMRHEADRVARIPSIWPTKNRLRGITSRFGYRKDPFTRRVRHHSGRGLLRGSRFACSVDRPRGGVVRGLGHVSGQPRPC